MRRSYSPMAGKKPKPLGGGFRSTNPSYSKKRNRPANGSRLRTAKPKGSGLTKYR